MPPTRTISTLSVSETSTSEASALLPLRPAAARKRRRVARNAGWTARLALVSAAAVVCLPSLSGLTPSNTRATAQLRRSASLSTLSSLFSLSPFPLSEEEASATSSNVAPVRPYRPQWPSPHMEVASPLGTGEASSSSSASPPPPSDFELGVGRALDTLRRDYPTLLASHPDYSIYRRDISIIDPSGVHVHGLTAYKNAFRLLHAVVKLVYCVDRSSLNFKLCFDKARQNIRIHWHAHVVPREIFGGVRTTLHVDGISVYELDKVSGNVTEHRIEQLLINDQPIMPEEGLIAALQDRHLQGASAIPTFCRCGAGDFVAEFRAPLWPGRHPSLLFAWEGMEQSPGAATAAAQPPQAQHRQPQQSKAAHQHQQQQKTSKPPPVASGGGASSAASSSPSPVQPAASLAADTVAAASADASSAAQASPTASASSATLDLDWAERLERKNQSRKKFGLKPLSAEEFVELEKQVAELEAQQLQKKLEAAAASNAAADAAKNQGGASGGPNLFERIFGTVLKDTCETNFDCERPEICCDFGFKKMCCASGTPVGSSVPQYALVPVPIDVGPQPRPGESGGRPPRY